MNPRIVSYVVLLLAIGCSKVSATERHVLGQTAEPKHEVSTSAHSTPQVSANPINEGTGSPASAPVSSTSTGSPGSTATYNAIQLSQAKHLTYAGDLGFLLQVNLQGNDGNCAYDANSNETGLQIVAGMITPSVLFDSYLSDSRAEGVSLYSTGNLCAVTAYPIDYKSAPIFLSAGGSAPIQIGEFLPLTANDPSSYVYPVLCENRFSSVCTISLAASIRNDLVSEHMQYGTMPSDYSAVVDLSLFEGEQHFKMYVSQ